MFYTELNPLEFEKRLLYAPIAYLPLGTLEWHGDHLPLGTDGLISSGFFRELARKVGGIILPMLFLGPDMFKNREKNAFYGMDIVGNSSKPPRQLVGSAYWVDDELFKRILEAILNQLKRAGFRIVVAHGHGPSTLLFNEHLEEWRKEFGLALFTCWEKGQLGKFDLQTGHAARNETSLMMALRPDLVHLDNLPTHLDERSLGLIGKDPRKYATSVLGEKIIDLQVTRMEALLKQTLGDLL
ncbi:MAG: creatininase family protein [Candidatus Heimdallarchaeota archaeon]|nr:creatininase family protein [Candidatus Heimdallarchaeota archaeon]